MNNKDTLLFINGGDKDSNKSYAITTERGVVFVYAINHDKGNERVIEDEFNGFGTALYYVLDRRIAESNEDPQPLVIKAFGFNESRISKFNTLPFVWSDCAWAITDAIDKYVVTIEKDGKSINPFNSDNPFSTVNLDTALCAVDLLERLQIENGNGIGKERINADVLYGKAQTILNEIVDMKKLISMGKSKQEDIVR